MNTHFKRKKLTGYLLAILFGLGASSMPAWAGHPEVSLPGSNFEIEDPAIGDGANIKVDDGGDSIDWANVPGLTIAEDFDITIGNKTDDSAFGQGTAEDDHPPSVVAGGVPPNKSDLLKFGVATEETDDQYIHMFWTRVNNPSGTVNMDFEFNQSGDVVIYNTVPVIEIPLRTAGDLLIQYDLTGGGTDLANVELFLAEWLTAASAAPAAASDVCEASNSFPCWGARINLTTAGLATGSANGAMIPTGEAAGLDDGAGLDEVTFGEASLNLSDVLGDEECVTFGKAYLKSRSSDSFNAALKDIIPPIAVNISNCGTFTLVKKDDTGTLLPGADFTLFEDEGVVGTYEPATDTTVVSTCTTDIDGECSFINIFAGDYCMVETSPPANHIGADPLCFTFDPDEDEGLVLEFVNRRLGFILVRKEDQNGDLLPEAVFKVTAAVPSDMGAIVPADGVPSLPLTMTESPNGFHCADGLPLKDADGLTITYTVNEDVIPDGYSAAGALNMDTMPTAGTCDDKDTGNPHLTFVNERLPGAIKITKTTKTHTNPAAPIPHPGVTFTIKDAEGVTVGVVETDMDGVACLDTDNGLSDLEFGETYTVVETVPTGYAGEDPKAVEITGDATCGSGDEDEVAFHNTPLGKFTISYDSLTEDGHGSTKATVTCTDAGFSDIDLEDDESIMSNVLNFETQATYECTIVIDP